MKTIDPSQYNDQRDIDRVKKHRDKIMKDTVLTDAPEEYWHIGYCEETGMNYQQFMELPIEIRAKHLARRSLASMLDIVDRHFEVMKENIKNVKSNNANSK